MQNRKKRFLKMKVFMVTVTSAVLFSVPVYANGIDSLKLFSGTRNLAAAITGGLTALVAVLTTAFAMKAGTALQTAGEEEKPRKKKELIETIGIGVVLTCIPALITWILAFYV